MNTIVTCGSCGLEVSVPVGNSHGGTYSCPRCHQPINIHPVPVNREAQTRTESLAGCPHCHQCVTNDGRLVGQVVSCPFCRNAFVMPPVMPAGSPGHPHNTPGSLHVRVAYTHHGYDRQPDFGSSVILVPAELREKVPIWVIDGPEWELLRDEEMERVRERAMSLGVRSATAGFEGEIVIENLQPGKYWLVVMSHCAGLPVSDRVGVGRDRNPTLQILSRLFSGLDYGAVDGRKVVTEEITVVPGQHVVREQCFTLSPMQVPPNPLHYEMTVMQAARKARGERGSEAQERQKEARARKNKPSGTGCLLLSLVLVFLFVTGASVLLPVLPRG